jgi:hypothetical protein
MKKIALIASACLLPAIAPAPSSAGTMMQACQTVPCIYDHNNVIIGVPNGNGSVLRQIRQEWVTLYGVQINGLTQGQTYYFTTSDCQGQVYLYTGTSIPRPASFDGARFWFPVGDSQAVAYNSYSWGGTCYKNSGAILASPASHTANKVFETPFKVQ